MTNAYKVSDNGSIEKLSTDELKEIAGGARTRAEALAIIASADDCECESICFSYREAKDLSKLRSR